MKLNKQILYLIVIVLSAVALILVYNFTKDNKKEVSKEEKKTEIKEMDKDDALKIGKELIDAGLNFYLTVPRDFKDKTTLTGKRYGVLNDFTIEANDLFTEEARNDFSNYFGIVKNNEDYLREIKEHDDKNTIVYDEIELKIFERREEKITFTATWKYCEKLTSVSKECDKKQIKDKSNKFIIIHDKTFWKIDKLELPN